MTLKLDKRIYKIGAVKASIRDYREFAEFSLSEDGNDIVVAMENIDFEPVEKFSGEFCNYIIHKMVAQSR